jgi:hypothetical protein
MLFHRAHDYQHFIHDSGDPIHDTADQWLTGEIH